MDVTFCSSAVLSPPALEFFSSMFCSVTRFRWMNLLQALVRATGVLDSPIPSTNIFSSRSRMASLVKSLSLVTRQNPCTLFLYRISMASMAMAISVAFFPDV